MEREIKNYSLYCFVGCRNIESEVNVAVFSVCVCVLIGRVNENQEQW